MLTRSLFILLAICTCCYINAQSPVELVQKANALYDQNKKQEANALYEKAALLNNADAHFYLAYRYAVSEEKRLFHYEKAAGQAHGEAMKRFLEEIFFRQSDLFKSDPFKALAVYERGKKVNPSMQFYDEAGSVRVIKYATEAGPFDAGAFLKKYRVDTSNMHHPYAAWELAEEASGKKGRFSDIDNKLLLQLISRGGSVPAELMIAIDTAYKAWKRKQHFDFNICHYVTSGYGMGYCARRSADAAEAGINKAIIKLSAGLTNNSGRYLEPAYKTVAAFLESKVWNEELHGGSGYAAWATESLVKQKRQFIKLIEDINAGSIPNNVGGAKDNDAQLNKVYKDLLVKLRKKPLTDFNAEVNADGLRKTQRLWIPYRDATVALLYAMKPDISRQQWTNWLTEQRIKDLKAVINYPQ